MSQKILVTLTSFEKYPNLNRATGLWLGEAVHFLKKVEDADYEVDFVSPRGGYTPIDPQPGHGRCDGLAVVSEKRIHEPARAHAETERGQPGRLRRDLLHRRPRRDLGFSRERGAASDQPKDLRERRIRLVRAPRCRGLAQY